MQEEGGLERELPRKRCRSESDEIMAGFAFDDISNPVLKTTDVSQQSVSTEKRPACLQCHNSRLRCVRESESQACLRCKSRGKTCKERPKINHAMNKGVPNIWKTEKTTDDALLLVAASIFDPNNTPRGYLSASNALSDAWKKLTRTGKIPKPVVWALRTMMLTGTKDGGIPVLSAASLASLKSCALEIDLSGKKAKKVSDKDFKELKEAFEGKNLSRDSAAVFVITSREGAIEIRANKAFEEKFVTQKELNESFFSRPHFHILWSFVDSDAYRIHLANAMKIWMTSPVVDPDTLGLPTNLQLTTCRVETLLSFRDRHEKTYNGRLTEELQLFEDGCLWLLAISLEGDVALMKNSNTSSSSSSSSSLSESANHLPSPLSKTGDS